MGLSWIPVASTAHTSHGVCYTRILLWACGRQAADYAVGEEDPACKRDSFSCGLRGGTERRPDNEGWDTPYGGKHSTPCALSTVSSNIFDFVNTEMYPWHISETYFVSGHGDLLTGLRLISFMKIQKNVSILKGILCE